MLPHISPAVHEKNAEWYAKNYYDVEDDIIPVFEKLDTPLLDRLLKPKMKVLDAMMGRGRHVIRYAVKGCIVTGNDLNPHMVDLAKRAAKRAGIGKDRVTFLNQDATRLSGVKSGSFDATIAMFSALGTIPGRGKRQEAMAEFARATKRGGLVVVHAHNRLDGLFEKDFFVWSWKNLFLADKGLERGDIMTEYNGLDGMFNHFYTPGEFRKSFRTAGLEVVREHYYDYSQKREITGPFKSLRADGFIFVARRA